MPVERPSPEQVAVLEAVAALAVASDERGRVLYLNSAFRGLTEYDLTTAQGRPFWELCLQSDDREAARKAFERACSASTRGDIARHTCAVTCRRGEKRLVEWTHKPVTDPSGAFQFTLSIGVDITGRHRTQEDLERSRRGFRTVIESITDGITILREGRIVYGNATFRQSLGFDDEADWKDRKLVSLMHPEERQELSRRLDAVAAGDDSESRGEYRLTRLDGEVLRVMLPVVAPIEFRGEPAVLVVFRDVTESRQLEARLRVADRLTSVGTLAAGVAHEVNNPLASVVANLSLLAEELPELTVRLPDGEQQELEEILDDAIEGADRVQQIVRDLSTFARSESVTMGPVDLHRVLDATLNMAANQIRHRALLVKRFDPVPPVRGNEGQLGQVFLNLVINAAQAIASGHATENRIEVICTVDEPGWVVVEVADTGPGMTTEVKRRIFDPFFTTKPIGEGIGLGLAMVHSIVTSMGGAIHVDSTPGVGTRFQVQLPAMSPPPEAVSSEPRRRLRGARRNVLVVDDEPMITKSLTRALKKHEVRVAASGREALQMCREREFDLIICDLLMPELTGMDVYEELRQIRPGHEARIVFMTGGAFTPRSAEFLEKVPNLWFEKPFNLREVRTLLEHELLNVSR